jgi:hypothetical protein
MSEMLDLFVCMCMFASEASVANPFTRIRAEALRDSTPRDIDQALERRLLACSFKAHLRPGPFGLFVR